MESRLPKPKISTAPSGMSFRSKIKSLKSQMELNGSGTSKLLDIDKLNPDVILVKESTVDENKAPQAKVGNEVAKLNNIKFVKPIKRPAPTTAISATDSKKPNLRTNMKVSVRPARPATSIGLKPKPTTRPVRPATSIGLKPKPTTSTSIAAIAAKTSGPPKPSKWDYKGRLEYASNELAVLKKKHKEITTQYNDIQEEIFSLKESEHVCRSRTEELEKTAEDLSSKVTELTNRIDELEKENKYLTQELNCIKESHQIILEDKNKLEEECKLKTTQLTEQIEKGENLKDQYDILEKITNEKINNLQSVNKNLFSLVQDLDKERRVLHNNIQELKGNIRVFCRVRPKIPKELSKNSCIINFNDECSIEISKSELTDNRLKPKQEFTFDRVFPPNASQADVFEELAMLVQSALEGYNVCIFAYGQTGSGKTYTMEGSPGTEEEGMIPRTVEHIFNEMKQFELLGWEYKIDASFLEIYNEQIVDLLDSQRKSHEIRMTDNKRSDIYVSNLHIQEINSPEELHQCLLIAQKNRAVAATQSNERSSRSHSVARIRLTGTHKHKKEICIGNLNLVDLAGSERLKNEEAARTTETKNINKSLANLGHVILALLQKQDHIPYRNSKLTHLLMPSLGGNSKTLMLLNISPLDESYNETLNSLRFGSNVNSCKTGTIKRVKTTL